MKVYQAQHGVGVPRLRSKLQNGIYGKVHGTMTSIVPYRLFTAFVATNKVPLRRDEGIAPYRAFIAWQRGARQGFGVVGWPLPTSIFNVCMQFQNVL